MEVSVIRSGEGEGFVFHTLYFNGEREKDGVTRIYAKLYEPKAGVRGQGLEISKEDNGLDAYTPSTPQKLAAGHWPLTTGRPAVIVFDDIKKPVGELDPAPYLACGFSVLAVDYAGTGCKKERFTLYPKSLSHVNCAFRPEPEEETGIPPTRGSGYVYATVALRAITFLEAQGFGDIFMLGIGLGGAPVWKACYFDGALRAGAVIFSDGPRKTPPRTLSAEEEKRFMVYRAAIDSSAYAKSVKCPVFMQVTSNEQNSSLDYMSELYETATPGNAFLSIFERADRYLDKVRQNNVPLWFSSFGVGKKLPAPPKIRAKGSQNKLYYEIRAATPCEIAEISLFVAHIQKAGAYRNWRSEHVERVTEGEYLARVSVLSASDPVYAFVNVRYSDGLVISSKVSCIIPSALSVTPAPQSFKRLIYDSGMGISDWLVLSGDAADRAISMRTGPHNLEGVSGASGLLTTFRLADPSFKGRDGSALQFTVYSPVRQSVNFGIRVSDAGFSKFVCVKTFAGEEAWIKFSLSPSDFKGAGVALTDWSGVLTLEIESAAPVAVSSLLWV